MQRVRVDLVLGQYFSWRDRFLIAWLVPAIEEALKQHQGAIPPEDLYKIISEVVRRAGDEWNEATVNASDTPVPASSMLSSAAD